MGDPGFHRRLIKSGFETVVHDALQFCGAHAPSLHHCSVNEDAQLRSGPWVIKGDRVEDITPACR